MNIGELARRIGAELFPAAAAVSPDVRTIHAACTMSSLIAGATPETLLVTSLCNRQLIRIAELMDAPGLCVTSPARPGEELLSFARQRGITVLASPCGLEETRRRLEACLGGCEVSR